MVYEEHCDVSMSVRTSCVSSERYRQKVNEERRVRIVRSAMRK